MWNLKSKINKQSRNRPIYTENKLVAVRGRRWGGGTKISEGEWEVQASSYRMSKSQR